jgi:hypothetical protein
MEEAARVHGVPQKAVINLHRDNCRDGP